MPDIATNEPVELRAGDTWTWRRDDLAADYPAPAWALSYYFKRHDGNFSINAQASGAGFLVNVDAATTKGYTPPGAYLWFAFVVNGGERHEVDRGTLIVLPDLAVPGNLDVRTHVRKVLDAIEAVLEKKATKDQQEYTIGNRSLKRIPPEELMVFRQMYRSELEREEAKERLKNGAANARRLRVRF